MAVDPAVTGVIGHWSRQTTTAALPVYEQAGLPVVIPVAGDYGASTTAFRLAPDDAALAGAAAQYVATAYPGLPVLLAIDSLDLETGLRGALNEAGVSIADDAADAGVLLFSAGYEKTVQTLNAHRDLPAILLDELYTPLLESLLEDGAGGQCMAGPSPAWKKMSNFGKSSRRRRVERPATRPAWRIGRRAVCWGPWTRLQPGHPPWSVHGWRRRFTERPLVSPRA